MTWKAKIKIGIEIDIDKDIDITLKQHVARLTHGQTRVRTHSVSSV